MDGKREQNGVNATSVLACQPVQFLHSHLFYYVMSRDNYL
jgi:hypothetical protein